MAHRLKRPGDRLFWWCYATVYDALWDNALTASLADAVAARVPADADLMEIGAGTGIITGRLVEAGLPVTACEPQPAMARRFARRLPETALHVCRFEEIPYRGYQVAVNVVHLMPQPAAALQLMQGRGTVLVITPEPRAGLVRVVRAQRRYGSSRRRAVRFVALHLLLGPLAVLCGVSPAGRLDWMGAEGESLEGVYRLILRDGQSESVPR